MKYSILVLVSLLAFLEARSQETGAPIDSFRARQFTPSQMQADFRYLRRALEETHPGLYRYHSRQEMSHEMDSLEALLVQPMGYYDYYRLLAGLIADIRCAHTTILPRSNLLALFQTYRSFPFGVVYIGNRVYLMQNASADTVVRPGDELLSINGRPIDSINAILFRHIWADGYNLTLTRRTLSDAMFAFFYYLDVEQPDHYDITCRNLEGRVIRATVAPIRLVDFDKNTSSNPVNAPILAVYGPRTRLNRKQPWRMEMHRDKDAAVITLRNFGGNGNPDVAARKLRDFLGSSVGKIRKAGINNVIFDLRDNGGGWDNLGEVLYTFLIDTPSYYYARLHTVTDSSEFLQYSSVSKEELKNIKNELVAELDGTFTVKEQFNATLAKQYPQKDRFTQKVYFLINGLTGSSTAEFTALAHSHHLGTLVGLETGGNYTGGNGGEFIGLQLPETRIRVRIPLEYYTLAVTAPVEKGRGTIPDYEVPYNIKDVVAGRDTQLRFVYGLIGRGK